MPREPCGGGSRTVLVAARDAGICYPELGKEARGAICLGAGEEAWDAPVARWAQRGRPWTKTPSREMRGNGEFVLGRVESGGETGSRAGRLELALQGRSPRRRNARPYSATQSE